MRQHQISPLLFFSTALCFSANAFAQTDEFGDGYFQLRAGAGVAWLSTEDATIGVIPNETDSLKGADSDDAAAVDTLGYGYVMTFDCDDDCNEAFRFFPGMIISLDGSYQFENELSGEVWRSNDPTLDTYDYELGIQNINLLANLTLGIVEYNRWTIFGVGGAGAAWSWVNFEATSEAFPPQGNLELAKGSNTTFAWQVGGGVGVELVPEVDLTLTYLYTDLGDVQTSSTVSSDNIARTVHVTPAEFDLIQQGVILGLQWNFL